MTIHKPKKSYSQQAVEWVARDPTKRTDAAASRKFGLLSSACLWHWRKGRGIDRAGMKINILEV